MSKNEFEKQFKTLRKNKEYGALGNLFFRAFCTFPSGKSRDFICSLYDSLSKKEKKLIEEF